MAEHDLLRQADHANAYADHGPPPLRGQRYMPNGSRPTPPPGPGPAKAGDKGDREGIKEIAGERKQLSAQQ